MAERNAKTIDRDIERTLRPPGRIYYLLLAICLSGVGVGAVCWFYQIRTGIGVAGINNPVGWGVYITNFVFWVGIAHSGTLISAILFLLRARWRTSIFRSAEAMTVIAIMTAGLFPLIHLGRPWQFYWLMPYDFARDLWPNFQSPLLWDVFAVMTYFVVSLTFLYLGLIPDLATLRDRAKGIRRHFYRLLGLGWTGSSREWRHYTRAYGFFAALATPLVVSVHSVVSWDFAMSIVPGWHSTIFAPYFVAGAIHSGLAMVITLLIPMRRVFGLQPYLTVRHFENLAKLVILTGIIVGYSYLMEVFIAWYSGNPAEQAIFLYRMTGDYAGFFWVMIVFNSILPLAFFWRRVRTSLPALFVIGLLINVGMWTERFVIIVTSLAHEYLPYAWGTYQPSPVEIGITVGSFSWFLLFFLLFLKIFPSVSITEVKEQAAHEATVNRQTGQVMEGGAE
jgi:molybdopterin-containing oxidoreductase family membrane subunit